MSFKSALLIPDQHIFAGCNLRRYDALSNLLADRQPDYIINGGDALEFEILYGIHGKKSWTYRDETADTVEADIRTNLDANNKLFKGIEDLQRKQKKRKKKPYEPETHFCLGNHDHRGILYYSMNQCKFEERGYSTLDDFLMLKQFWNNVHEYQKPVEIEGIVFSHNFVNGTATASTVDTITKLAAQSAGGFHSHKAEFKASRTTTQRPIYGLQAGWFFDPEDSLPGWVGLQGGSDWWNGVVYLHGIDGTGAFDPEFISTVRLLKEYL